MGCRTHVLSLSSDFFSFSVLFLVVFLLFVWGCISFLLPRPRGAWWWYFFFVFVFCFWWSLARPHAWRTEAQNETHEGRARVRRKRKFSLLVWWPSRTRPACPTAIPVGALVPHASLSRPCWWSASPPEAVHEDDVAWHGGGGGGKRNGSVVVRRRRARRPLCATDARSLPTRDQTAPFDRPRHRRWARRMHPMHGGRKKEAKAARTTLSSCPSPPGVAMSHGVPPLACPPLRCLGDGGGPPRKAGSLPFLPRPSPSPLSKA